MSASDKSPIFSVPKPVEILTKYREISEKFREIFKEILSKILEIPLW